MRSTAATPAPPARSSRGDHEDGSRNGAPRGPGAGVAVSLAAAAIGVGLARLNPILSPLLVAIVLGVIAGHVMPIARMRAGLDFAGKRLLRVGIVLLGLQISLDAIIGLGWGVVMLAAAVVGLGVPAGVWFGRRLGLTPTQATLTACGFGICGAAAVAAADEVIDGDADEVATSVGLVVLFGTLMIPLTVMVAALGLDARTAGIFVGASVHEVGQVVAAGGLVGGGALGVAVVVKIARVLMLAPVMAVLSARRRRDLRTASHGGDMTLPPLVPFFVLAFIAAVIARTALPLSGSILGAAQIVQTVLLAAAMFALGTGVTWTALKRVGSRPLVHALACTCWVALIAGAGTWALA